MTEPQLLEHITQAQNNNQQAFTALYDEYKNLVYCLIKNRITNDSDIQDVMQEAFINAFNSIHTLKEPKKFKNWLLSIADKKAVDFYRRNRKKNEQISLDSEPSIDESEDYKAEFIPSELLETEETRNYIMELVSKLPKEQNVTVFLYYYQQMSVSDIAEVMECSEGTVKSRLNYARKFIKAEIEKQTKKGYKVIAVAPLPLLTKLLLWQYEQAKLPPSVSADVLNGIENMINTTASGTAKVETFNTGTEVASKTATSGIKIAGLTVPTKVAAVVGSLVGLSAVVAVVLVSQPKENAGIVAASTTQIGTEAHTQTSNSGEATENSVATKEDMSDLGVLELKTKSDYAKMYYDMVQKVYKNDEGFLDAEIAYNSFIKDVYSLELIYKEADSYKFYFVTIDPDVETYDFSKTPETALRQTYKTHIGMVDRDGNTVDCAMIVKDYDREAVLRTYGKKAILEWRRRDEWEFTVVYMARSDAEPNTYRSIAYRGSKQEYSEEININDLKANIISTWGIGHSDAEFTYGERLKAYFED